MLLVMMLVIGSVFSAVLVVLVVCVVLWMVLSASGFKQVASMSIQTAYTSLARANMLLFTLVTDSYMLLIHVYSDRVVSEVWLPHAISNFSFTKHFTALCKSSNATCLHTTGIRKEQLQSRLALRSTDRVGAH